MSIITDKTCAIVSERDKIIIFEKGYHLFTSQENIKQILKKSLINKKINLYLCAKDGKSLKYPILYSVLHNIVVIPNLTLSNDLMLLVHNNIYKVESYKDNQSKVLFYDNYSITINMNSFMMKNILEKCKAFNNVIKNSNKQDFMIFNYVKDVHISRCEEIN